MRSQDRFHREANARPDNIFEFMGDPALEADRLHKPVSRPREESEKLREEWNRFTRKLGGKIRKHTSWRIGQWKIPWTRLLLIGLAVYVLTYKDLQFSLDMKAPLAVAGQPWQMAPGKPTPGTPAALPVLPADRSTVGAYIQRFDKVAVAEARKYGIPASIKMAQALLESKAGQSPDCRQANNHFGTPLAGQLFNSAWANWRAHSELLRRDYPELFRLGTDPQAWARELERLGYSPAEDYAENLLRIIRTYRLERLDRG